MSINFRDKTRLVRLTKALEAIFAHCTLKSNRWPCPFCGRENSSAPLKEIAIVHTPDQYEYHGCWYCNLEPILLEARTEYFECGAREVIRLDPNDYEDKVHGPYCDRWIYGADEEEKLYCAKMKQHTGSCDFLRAF